MRQIKELLRLKHEHGLSIRQIARSCGLPASTAGDYLKRAQKAGLSWPLPEELTEDQLLDRLLGSATQAAANPPARALPDGKAIHQELRRKGVTLQLLWNEYHQFRPEGYAYSRFCERYREWEGTLDPVLRTLLETFIERRTVGFVSSDSQGVRRRIVRRVAAPSFVEIAFGPFGFTQVQPGGDV